MQERPSHEAVLWQRNLLEVHTQGLLSEDQYSQRQLVRSISSSIRYCRAFHLHLGLGNDIGEAVQDGTRDQQGDNNRLE